MLRVDIQKRLTTDRSGGFELEVSFVAGDGITLMFGHSGAGKTTTLKAIAGVMSPDRGRITVGDQVYFDSVAGIDVPIQARRIGYVFQEYALFPHLTAAQNVAYGVKNQAGRREKLEKARSMLALFELEHVKDRYPEKMSGGERQRTALARALASDPAVVLLDEPLSAVDAHRRARFADAIVTAQELTHIPFIYVTHNIEEAMRLGSDVVTLSEGKVQSTTPHDKILARSV
jgi:molybdate transport system ATP-binding protein